jgi:hypothetical protein
MRGRETFFRSRELKRECRMLPAETYNLAKILLHQSGEPALFVPIRNMLYLAAIDREEIIFLDGAISRCTIVLAWQKFRPQQRSRLNEPISYETVYYADEVLGIMPRLQGEFDKALRHLREKSRATGTAKIITLKKP